MALDCEMVGGGEGGATDRCARVCVVQDSHRGACMCTEPCRCRQHAQRPTHLHCFPPARAGKETEALAKERSELEARVALLKDAPKGYAVCLVCLWLREQSKKGGL